MNSVGIDIVKIDRIRQLYNDFGELFLEKILSKKEIKQFQKIPKMQNLAGIFAAKEATIKALTLPHEKTLIFQNIEIVKKNNKPKVVLVDSTLKTLNIEVSISHEHEYAVAVVIIDHE